MFLAHMFFAHYMNACARVFYSFILNTIDTRRIMWFNERMNYDERGFGEYEYSTASKLGAITLVLIVLATIIIL